MNILTDILSLLKRKQYITQLKGNDVVVVGVHEEPNMLGIASPVPYKSVRLAKISDLNNYLDNKIDIREPLTCPVTPYADTATINIAKESSLSFTPGGFEHYSQRLTLNGASTASPAFISLRRHDFDSNYNGSSSAHAVRLINEWSNLNVTGAGSFFSISGSLNFVKLQGGNAKIVTVMYGGYDYCGVEDTGLTDVSFVVGSTAFVNVSNPQANILNLYLFYSSLNAVSPTTTIDDVISLYINVSPTTALAQINNYYAIYHEPGPANAATNWFIYSLYDAPSLFTGSISAKEFNLNALNAPVVNSTDPGNTGEIRIDSNYIYVCIAPSTWKRAQLLTW